jgi:hypothetical protein
VLAPASASAAPKDPSGKSQPLQLHKDEPGGNDGTLARSRARSGDCAGALPSFDAAIRTTIEPTLRRDRGLCHEKLNHPYPAIDDYRAYLTARPDANDADQIREHLARLEEQTGQGGPSSQASKNNDSSSSSSSGEASASVSVGSSGASASSSSSGSSKHKDEGPSSSEKDYDSYLAQERLADAADTSPLRYGEGWILGPLVHIPRFFVGGAAPKDMAYAVGGTIRYSTGPTFALVSEVAYGGIGKSGDTTAAGGPLVFLGGELRVGISHYNSDQILVGGGLGFERYVVSGTRVGADFIPLRGRLGYRHVFGPAVGIEATLDGGAAYMIPDSQSVTTSSAPSGTTTVKSDNQVVGVVGGTFAFLVGF